MSTNPTNSDDMIDSRDVIKRIEELEEEREALVDRDASTELTEWDVENQEELRALKALAEEAEGCADWLHGEQLIRDSYFKDYAQELADDLDLMRTNAAWPYTCIDWEKAAEELKADYTSVDFGGVTYWIRS
jgi:hypothetical protein